MISIDEARGVLGDKANGVSDQDLERDIDTAEFFANIFLI